jgi:hypothetical protein
MSTWLTQPVTDQPNITLVRWRIFQTEREELHFVGFYSHGYEGRVSSAIQSFDALTRRGVTKSGRVYELSGPPGFDQDALYVWEAWMRAYRVPSYTDVTDDVVVGLQSIQ